MRRSLLKDNAEALEWAMRLLDPALVNVFIEAKVWERPA